MNHPESDPRRDTMTTEAEEALGLFDSYSTHTSLERKLANALRAVIAATGAGPDTARPEVCDVPPVADPEDAEFECWACPCGAREYREGGIGGV